MYVTYTCMTYSHIYTVYRYTHIHRPWQNNVLLPQITKKELARILKNMLIE